jgi:transposase-like protein
MRGHQTVGSEEGSSKVGRKRHTPEQIIGKLREAEIALSQGKTVPQACKQIGVSEQTYYRWRKEYGGIRLDQAKRLKALEKENQRLKRVVADQALDISILKEVAEGNF